MSPIHSSKNRSAHRVPCVCRVFECYRGQYVYADGRTQAGVEVLPATLAAHKLSDKVQQAASNVSTNQRISVVDPNAPYSTAEQESLIGAISHLHLDHNSPLSPGSHGSGSSPTVDGSRGPKHKQTSNKSSSRSKECEAVASATNAGVQVYNCGALLNWSHFFF